MPSCSCFCFRDVGFIRTCNRFNVLQRSQKALKPSLQWLTWLMTSPPPSRARNRSPPPPLFSDKRAAMAAVASCSSVIHPFHSGYFGPVFQPLGVLTLHFKSSEKCFSRFRVGLWQLMMPFCGWTKQQCNVYEFMAKYAIQQHLFQAKAESTTKTNYDVGKCCNFQLWQHFTRILFHSPGQGSDERSGNT